MADVDPDSIPFLLGKQDTIADKDGKPTTPMLDWLGGLWSWMKRSVVDLTTKISTVQSDTDDAHARITTEIIARTTADSALASQITTVEASVGSNTAAISAESTARANGDSALASNISTVSTTVAGNTASISTLQTSVNGLGVQWAVQGNVGGTYGGLVFTGIQRADGTGAVYSLEIASNVYIYGNLVVSGTITGLQMASGAASTSANNARGDDVHAPGSPNSTVSPGGGTWADYTSVTVSPNYDARIEVKWEAENIVTTSGSGTNAAHEVRMIRRKGGDTPLGRGYTVSAANGISAVDRYFPTIRDTPGTGSVTYVIQHRVYSGTVGSSGGYTARCLYGSITVLVSER